jgi:hypothetical protein
VTPEDEAAAALARRAIAAAAPEELPLFRATSGAYFENPERTLTPRNGGDELLGFGAEAAMLLVTPIALDVAKAALTFVLARIRDAAADEAGSTIDGAVGRLFGRLRGDAAADIEPVLSRDQLADVRRVARERALALDLPAAKADLLADSIVGSLA